MYDKLSIHIESDIETLMCFKNQLKIILMSNHLLQMSFGKLISSCGHKLLAIHTDRGPLFPHVINL